MPTVLERARVDSSKPQNRDGAYGATDLETNPGNTQVG